MITALTVLAKPFIVLAFLGLLLIARYAVIWWLPEGKLKRLLLYRI